MAKLYFRYGTMGSAKTLNLLAVAHNYQQQGKPVVLLKPKMDHRFGEAVIQSRAGLSQNADGLLALGEDVNRYVPEGTVCVLVDEAQFLTADLIEKLRDLVTFRGIPVICYGLRTNFYGQLFSGSQRLMELADTLEEIKTTCHYCDRKATMNLKIADEKHSPSGLMLGAEETFLPACYACFVARSPDFKRSTEQGQ